METIIKVISLGKCYGEEFIFKDVSFELFENEILVIMGPSGIGKSTLLNLIANLDTDYQGEIYYNPRIFESVVAPLPLVFQDFETLVPWLNVAEQLSLVNPGLTKTEIESYLNLVELYQHKDKMPSELSGGMKQRLALVRALVCRSKIILMDEPFSSLDQQIKSSLYTLLLKIKQERNISIILVTHDPNEARILGDRTLNLGASSNFF